LYHVCVHFLAQRLLSQIRRDGLLKAGDRVGVAVSGGVDSVALMRLLMELRSELGIVLSVVHFNHKLRGAESDADQEFVAGLARVHNLEFCSDSDDVGQSAAEEHISVETAARELRYGFFRYLLGEDGEPQGLKPQGLEGAVDRSAGSAAPPKNEIPGFKLDKIVTGHTLDDQAETVLMRLIRGAGMRGLGGIYPRITVEDDGEACGEIVRPLLEIRRRELRQYLFDIRQDWHEDSTNADVTLTRNRVRKLVIPLLEKEFNPAVASNLAELAEIARGEEDYWENEAAGWMGTAVHWSAPEWVREVFSQAGLVRIESSQSGSLREKIENAPWLVMNASVYRLWFLGEPVAVQRRLVKAIAEHAGVPFEFKHVEEILRFAEETTSGKELSLPHGWKFVRQQDELIFLTPDLREPAYTQGVAQNYEYELPLPGRAMVYEAGSVVEAQRVPAGTEAEYNGARLLDAGSLPGSLRVRNWRPGDRFWPAHTKSPKKIKELLQEQHVPQPERRFWPVVVSGDEIVWVRGLPLPDKFRAQPGREAILIEEKPLQEMPST
jgi:tRNA(Ile)-lysidine synthase